jgi:hypothetical protein
VKKVGIELMILGGIQAGMSVKGGIDAHKAAQEASDINMENYQQTSRGFAQQGSDRQSESTSLSKVMGGLGGNQKTGEVSAKNVALDTQLQLGGAKSQFLNNQAQIDQAEQQSRWDALSGVISGATLMTQGMMGGPKIAGKTVYDPRWGGLGGLMGWFTKRQ